jgi:amino acid adenylation domain-containing protein
MVMSEAQRRSFQLPLEQQAIRDRCFHPSGTFVEFSNAEIEQSIPQRFDEIARRYPDRLAVKMGDRKLSFDELNRAANRVAHGIIGQSGISNSTILLLFPQGVDVITAILAALKAGKCFVLADMSWPPERLAAILEDSQASLIVADRDRVHIASKSVGESIPWLDIRQLDDSFPTNNVGLDLSPELLGYIVYTSGSTGKPKGVFQNHRNILHGVMRRINGFRIAPDDRLTLLSSGGHQAIMNIFSAVLSGAAIFPFDAKVHSPVQLADWLRREGITIYHSSASLFHQLATMLTGDEDLSSIRLVRSASEATSNTDVELFQRHFSEDCIFSNGMGSTETGTSTLYFMGKHTAIVSERVPVGFPLNDMKILVVDDNGQEVKRECLGEIAIKSRYLALGYWRQPELSEAKFKRDPRDPAQRLYFTGDLGLMRPDGCLIHMGRMDFRVKIRGYGVELNEIERILLSHPAILHAVVVARENESGETGLIAYYTSRQAGRLTVSELRKFINEKLPDYMTPSAFVRLDALPLTPNGKVDRRALPDPGSPRPDLNTRYTPPATTTERQLASIWSKVLSVDQVGIHDNFFDLGGHSLAAFRMIARVIQSFQLGLPVKALFDAPTVAEMAAIITQTQTKQASHTEMAQMLREVEIMTEEEAQKQLTKQRAQS